MKLAAPSAKLLAKFHLIMMGVWTILLVPTLLFWKESILWVLIMSLYAIWIGHFSAYDAAKAAEQTEGK